MNNNLRIFIGTLAACVLFTAPLFLLTVNGVLLTAWLTSMSAVSWFATALYRACNRTGGQFVTTTALPLLIFRYVAAVVVFNIIIVCCSEADLWQMQLKWFIFIHLFLAVIFLWQVLAADAGREEIENVEMTVKSATSRIYALRDEAAVLRIQMPDNENITAVADALRYSDPVSDAALESIENEIATNISRLNCCSSDAAAVNEICNAILLKIKQRNLMCKSLKK